MKNIISMRDAMPTNNDRDAKFDHKVRAYDFQCSSPDTIIKTHIMNIEATFGEAQVKSALMSFYGLKTKRRRLNMINIILALLAFYLGGFPGLICFIMLCAVLQVLNHILTQ